MQGQLPDIVAIDSDAECKVNGNSAARAPSSTMDESLATTTGWVEGAVGFRYMPRFSRPEPMDKSERNEWVSRVSSKPWPEADVTNEERFEDWVDSAAAAVRHAAFNMEETAMIQLL